MRFCNFQYGPRKTRLIRYPLYFLVQIEGRDFNSNTLLNFASRAEKNGPPDVYSLRYIENLSTVDSHIHLISSFMKDFDIRLRSK